MPNYCQGFCQLNNKIFLLYLTLIYDSNQSDRRDMRRKSANSQAVTGVISCNTNIWRLSYVQKQTDDMPVIRKRRLIRAFATLPESMRPSCQESWFLNRLTVFLVPYLFLVLNFSAPDFSFTECTENFITWQTFEACISYFANLYITY